MVKHVDNLFFSDNAKVYLDKCMRSCILIIYHGLVYFLINDDELLSSNPREQYTLQTPLDPQKKKRDFSHKMLIFPAIHVFEDLKRVIMPRQSQNNQFQMAFQLEAYKKPLAADSLGSKHFISLKNQR